jgi:malate/lactate dehydrogenase
VQAPFFAAPVTLGPNGVEKIHPLGPMSAVEQAALDKAIPDLIAQVLHTESTTSFMIVEQSPT